jgi:hypothetical protein
MSEACSGGMYMLFCTCTVATWVSQTTRFIDAGTRTLQQIQAQMKVYCDAEYDHRAVTQQHNEQPQWCSHVYVDADN